MSSKFPQEGELHTLKSLSEKYPLHPYVHVKGVSATAWDMCA